MQTSTNNALGSRQGSQKDEAFMTKYKNWLSLNIILLRGISASIVLLVLLIAWGLFRQSVSSIYTERLATAGVIIGVLLISQMVGGRWQNRNQP